jgi:hypothetical protein
VGLGACARTGVRVCTSEAGAACDALPGPTKAETCGDGVDQDCDGRDAACPGDTPPGTGVTVRPVDTTTGTTPLTVTFATVTRGGTTTLTTTTAGAPPPGSFRLGSPPLFFDLSTTAAFSGSVEICTSYAGTRVRDERQIRLLHFEDGRWVDRTASLDTGRGVVCATVASLSPFAVLEAEPCGEDLTLPALECRLAALVVEAGEMPDLGRLRKRIVRGLARARGRMAGASERCRAGRLRGARVLLRRATRPLAQVAVAHSRKGRQALGAEATAGLLEAAARLREDARALRATLACP